MKDEEDEVVADWKFAAMVIDRYHVVLEESGAGFMKYFPWY